MNLNNPKCKGCNPAWIKHPMFITFLVGEALLKEIEYRIATNQIVLQGLFCKSLIDEYWVESDFMRLGPFYSKEEAMIWKRMLETQQ